MKRLILAIQFMTRLPMPTVAADAEDFAASIRWFPATGLIVGALVSGACLLYTSPSPRDRQKSRMPSSA